MSTSKKYTLSNGKDVYIVRFSVSFDSVTCFIYVPEYGKTLELSMTYQHMHYVERDEYPCPDGSRCSGADVVYGYVGTPVDLPFRRATNYPDSDTIISFILNNVSSIYYRLFELYNYECDSFYIVNSSLPFGVDYSIETKVCYLNASYMLDNINYCITDRYYPSSKYLLRGFKVSCCCLPELNDTKLSDIYFILGGS